MLISHLTATKDCGCTIRHVAYDEELVERLRELLDSEPRLSEKKMFGVLAFLISGNMAIAASGEGGVLVRVDPAESDKLVDASKAEVAVMRGRPMDGWLRVLLSISERNDNSQSGRAWVRPMPAHFLPRDSAPGVARVAHTAGPRACCSAHQWRWTKWTKDDYDEPVLVAFSV